MALQADCVRTYLGNNIFLPTAFYRVLLQGHILEIYNPDSPTGMSPLPTPLSSAGLENSQQRSTRVQVLISMGQD